MQGRLLIHALKMCISVRMTKSPVVPVRLSILFESGMFNHNVNVTGGIMEDKCASILTEFFRELRKKK